jgi:hypothetical protein
MYGNKKCGSVVVVLVRVDNPRSVLFLVVLSLLSLSRNVVMTSAVDDTDDGAVAVNEEDVGTAMDGNSFCATTMVAVVVDMMSSTIVVVVVVIMAKRCNRVVWYITINATRNSNDNFKPVILVVVRRG